jgi:hypothetical protein
MDHGPNTRGLCQCGCGQRTPLAKITSREKGWIKGEPVRFVYTHQMRGTTNPKYNGGLSHDGERTLVVCRDGSVTRYARAVMEAHIGRELLSDEHVHHINEDPGHDRIENLELLTPAEHIARHRVRLLAEQRAKASKLTPERVRAIDAADGSQAAVARRFGVSRSMVGLIKRGERWQHVLGTVAV